MNRKKFFNIVKILVSIGLLTYIFSTLDRMAFTNALRQANPWWLFAALFIVLCGVVLRAWRWQILLEAIGVKVTLPELTNIYFIGFLFNNLLPSGLGGDAVRMVELNRHSQRGSDAFTSVIVDRFMGLSALQALALLSLLFDWGAVPPALAYFTVVIFLGGLVAGYLLINRSLYLTLQDRIGLFRRLTQIKVINNLFESFQRYPLSALARSYAVALLFNMTHVVMNMCIGRGFGAHVTLFQYAILVPITSLVLLIPISFAGLGVREEAFRQLFAEVGVPAEVAVAMSLIVYFFGNVCTGLIGGVIYFLRSARGVVSVSDQ